ncbi:MAG: amidohydrolase family protein [Polymorphobacter sp.]
MIRTACRLAATTALIAFASPAMLQAAPVSPTVLFNDSHFHLTNYVQQGTAIRDYLNIMGDKIGRSTLFGIPLQQQWDYGNTGDFAPTYYLQSDAPLYYYSFTDAYIAMQYLSLSPAERARLDPMITGFDPADMYAADHIRRVLTTFPGVFSGIGEFTIHKEFVSSKVAGGAASLTNPALDRIFDFAGEVGLVAILHNDIDAPFAKGDTLPGNASQIRDLLLRHPKTTIIWAHTGLGRVVSPAQASASAEPGIRSLTHLDIIEKLLDDPALAHVYVDISWDEVAKYAVASPESIKRTADFINRHHGRILFGTDNVAPKDQATQLRVFNLWDPVFAQLTPQASYAVRIGNYNRLFDKARVDVRNWEAANLTAVKASK